MSNSEDPRRCRNCQRVLIRRNPLLLFAVGALFCGMFPIAFSVPYFLVPGIILLVAGIYLMAWATIARGMWCRQCKTFSRGE